ncbi:MAG: hypothetical protein K1000chlam2_00616 [Chlamydiae bacterium]|nr:hypothetical protein [Chlamydiota bacterium]
MKLRLLASLIATAPLFADDFVINLKDPEYSQGIVKTEKGGVITAPNLRIQARNITYINTKTTQKICAEGDLMMEYQGRIFVGEKLHFNLLEKTGYLIDGRSNVGIWYLGGDCLELLEDGNFIINGAFITTTVSRSNPWEIRAKIATISDGNALAAKSVSFNVLHVPVLWLPSYKTSLVRLKDSPIRYRILWDKGLGPRFSARYRFFSTDTFAAFARFDYRIIRGPGGALEAEYNSKDKRTFFQTRNYGALDKIFPDENGSTRYRFQGIYKTHSEDDYTRFHMQWDKMSDDRMVGDFKDPDFEVNTQKVTYLEFSHYKSWTFTELSVRPRINKFGTLNQELPYGTLGVRPFEIGRTGVIMENYASGSYFDYVYAKVLDEIIGDRKAGRLETINSIYRPFSLGGFTATPRAGIVGIYYSDSPNRNATGQFVYTYGGDANVRFSKQFQDIKHTVEPYAQYLGYTRPSTPVDDYFVFEIQDGYDRLDQVRFGLRQLFYSKSNPIFLPTLSLDLYSYGFWGARSFDQTIPKVFVDLTFNQPSWAVFGGAGWNIQENVLDYGNIRLLWTLSARLAFGLEFRHRSEFWWRKANYDNFVVDFARPLDELLASPLSDRRNTFLTKLHFRISPRWNMQVQTHHGWDRTDEPPYHGAKVDFYTMLTGSWQMKLTYEYMPNDPFRISYSFKLIK